MIGKTLGHYQIEAHLGAGGMGVVYRAHDDRLDRTVALKLVSEKLANQPGAREELLAEARTASDLNHPNICTIHDVAEFDDHTVIIMEYIEGSTLGAVVGEGGLPEEQVLRYGIQLTEGLDHADSHGIVHRDLKSANVMVTPEGRAKILDFGLARHIPREQLDAQSQDHTQIAAIDGIEGTLHYLAPETLETGRADHRSDLWALGVVLYEIATRDLPFRGRTRFDVASAILRENPAPLPASVSPGLRSIILRCLTKAPDQRYQHAAEVRAALETLQSSRTSIAPPILAPLTVRARWWPLALVAFVLLVTVAVFGWRSREGATDRSGRAGKLTLLMAPEGRIEDPVVSPDGKILAYVSRDHGQVDLFVRRVRGEHAIQLTDDIHAESVPAFSPDNEIIAYQRRTPGSPTSEIWSIPVFGGESRRLLADAGQPAWSHDGRSLAFVQRTESGEVVLATASISGENLRQLLPATVDYPFLSTPAWSPSGREIAVVRSSGGSMQHIWIVPTDGGEAWPLHVDGPMIHSSDPVFTPDGDAVVHSSNRGGAENLWRTRLDGSAPQRLTSGPGPDLEPSVSASGAVAFLNSRIRGQLNLLDLATSASRTILSHSRFLWAPVFSPDGGQVAFSRSESDGSWNIWICNVDGTEVRQVSPASPSHLHARFTPDGRDLVYYSWSPQPDRIWRIPISGGTATPLTPIRDADDMHPDVSPDGRWLAFTRNGSDGRFVTIMPVAGGPARTVVAGELPRWSPDGAWLTFAPDRSYAGGVSVIRPDGSEQRQLATTGGWPTWWPDGSRIGYLVVGADGNQQVWTVSVDGGEPSRVEGLEFMGFNYPVDVSLDGRTLVYTNNVHVADEIWMLEDAP